MTETIADCDHGAIRVYFDGERAAMWACGYCSLRFYPACRTCVDVGHRNVEHPASGVHLGDEGLRTALRGLLHANAKAAGHDPDGVQAVILAEQVARRALAGVHLGDEGLDVLRALSDAATPGYWLVDDDRIRPAFLHDGTTVLYTVELADPTNDAAFIVAAVNYVRALLATPAEGEDR